jgi:hypothetical protein
MGKISWSKNVEFGAKYPESKNFEIWPPNFEMGAPKMGKIAWIKIFEFRAKDPGVNILSFTAQSLS